MPRRIWDLVRLVCVEVGFRKRGFFRLGADILDKAGNVSSLTRSDLQFVDFELEQGGFRLESPVLAAARSNRWKYCPSGP